MAPRPSRRPNLCRCSPVASGAGGSGARPELRREPVRSQIVEGAGRIRQRARRRNHPDRGRLSLAWQVTGLSGLTACAPSRSSHSPMIDSRTTISAACSARATARCGSEPAGTASSAGRTASSRVIPNSTGNGSGHWRRTPKGRSGLAEWASQPRISAVACASSPRTRALDAMGTTALSTAALVKFSPTGKAPYGFHPGASSGDGALAHLAPFPSDGRTSLWPRIQGSPGHS